MDRRPRPRQARITRTTDITAASDDESNETYNGYRVLSEVEVTDLAIEIVEKVKERGPFFSVSDFVNRVTSEGATDK